MRKVAIFAGLALVALLAAPTAAFAQYTYLEFNCSPTNGTGTACSVPLNGVFTLYLSTSVSSTVPPGPVNWYCVAGTWNTQPDGSGISGGSCATLPYVPPGPACTSATGFVDYQVTQLKVYTPNDPSAPDVYMLGAPSTQGSGVSIKNSPLTVGPSTTLSVTFGPSQSPQTIGGTVYNWYIVTQDGSPVSGRQIQTGSPTGLPGMYLVDIEGTMYCGTSVTFVTQDLHFDIGIFISTPEFGTIAAAGVAAGSMVLLFLMRRRLFTPTTV